jgi:tetratricopeptide (TPR) repeat protein
VTLAAVPVWAADAIEPLDLKPGLWQIALTIRTSGPAPIPPAGALAKRKPAERARIDAQGTAKTAEGPRISVRRICLREKELQPALLLAFGGEVRGCRQTVTNASRAAQEIHVDCDQGGEQGGRTVRIEVRDKENAEVTSNWSATDGAGTLRMSSTATLQWLGAVCELDQPAASQGATPPATPSPADAGYYYKLGKEQAGRDDFWGALRSLNRAIEMDPRSAPSYNARGYVYLRLQSFANAIVEFSNAIRLRANYANAYRNRAIARRHLGDEAGAAEDDRRAAELAKSVPKR